MNYLDKFIQNFTYDVGIDLGTANTLVALRGYGIIINEPSVVAINQKNKEVLAVGAEARHMIGRTPSHITSVSPLEDGVITDFDSTEAMIRYFIQKVHKEFPKLLKLPRPRVVIGIPSQITEVEVRAVIDSALSAGARKVYIIEEPMAAAIGSNLPIQDATGNLVVDIGGGTTDIAVISLGGIVIDTSLKVAGNEMDEALVSYIRRKYNLLIGEKIAEDIKIEIGSAIPPKEKLYLEVKGRDLVTGLPNIIKISNVEVREAILPVLEKIAEAIKDAVEKTPPEMIADLIDTGIYLAGGGALIYGIDKFFEQKVKIPVLLVEDPLHAVARGTEILLEELELLEKVKLNKDEVL